MTPFDDADGLDGSDLEARVALRLPADIMVFRRNGALLIVTSSPLVAARRAPLTPAERAVFDLVRRGLDKDAIAAARGTSVRTVRHQLAALVRKLDVRSIAELGALDLGDDA